MAPHSSTLAWKTPWTEEPGRLRSMGSRRVRHDWTTSLSLFTLCIGEGNGNPLSVLAWRIPGTGGAWWAAIYGVTQSQTWLKWLSSSSSSSKETSCLTTSSLCLHAKSLQFRFSCVWFFVTPQTIALQAPLSMGFSKQEYWNELSFPYWGDLPNQGIEPRSPALQGDSLLSEPPGKPTYLTMVLWKVDWVTGCAQTGLIISGPSLCGSPQMSWTVLQRSVLKCPT